MRLIFLGTPDFALPSLKILIENGYDIAAVVTIPDKIKGRGKHLRFSPIKEFALQNNLYVIQPENLKDESFTNELKNMRLDIGVVVAFKILPRAIYTIPKFGMFNLHASLLPKYRGAAPIQWALINGEKITGVTTFFLEEKVDTGNIILQEEISVDDDDDFGSLHDKLSLLGANVVLKTIESIAKGKVELKKQDDSIATSAPKITKELCEINWTKPAEDIHNLIRGLSPIPGAYFKFKDKVIKTFKTKVVAGTNLKPGEFLQTKNTLVIGCGKNSLEILELQQEGKKRLKVEEFLRGFSFVA